MKTTLLATLALSLSFSAFAYVNVQKTAGSQLFDIAVDGLELNNVSLDGQTFSQATLVGVDGYTGIDFQLGAPQIPVIRLQVAADSAADITVVDRELKGEKAIVAGNLLPVVESAEKVPGAKSVFAKRTAYVMGAPFSVTELGSVRGQKQFLVTLRPLNVNGSALSIARSFEVEVKAPATKAVDAANGLLMVVGAKFKNSPELAAYVQLKQSLGFDVRLLDVAAGTSPESIRASVKELYSANKNLKYVLIVGDAEDVPGVSSNIIAGTSDHYYAAIDTNDYTSDILTPDLMVGRISVAGLDQLKTVLAKYTRYQKGDFTAMSWVERISFLATDDRYEVAEGTHNYVIDTYTKNLGYTGSFPNARNAGGDKLYAITHHAGNKEVMDAFLAGRSIIDYSGHGATTFWDAPRVSQEDVRSLKFSSLPFVISNACITGDFTLDESFAETWQRAEWGAVMFWGSMDSTYWDEDDILEKKMFDGIFKNKLLAFGDITHNAMMELSKFYSGAGRSQYYFETYHMFGDPSIKLKLK